MKTDTLFPQLLQCRDASTNPIADPLQIVENDVPRASRTAAYLRSKKFGYPTLSDAELLSLVLRTKARRSVRGLESELLRTSGSLRGVFSLDLKAALGQGLRMPDYEALQASLELARRHYEEHLATRSLLESPAAVKQYLKMQLRDLHYEVFVALFLNNRHGLIRYEELFRGTIDGASVHPREVVKTALSYNAAALIIAHNHPSGVASSSQADELITRRLKEALALVDIRLLDHLIVGDGQVESFAERGLI